MSVQSGHQMFNDTRTPTRQRPIDTDALRRSRIARGRAMHAARDDRAVRDALATTATEATETNPPPAA